MVKPLTARHIGQTVGLGRICGADFLGQQTEEDGCHFCAGDVAIRLDVAVRVADNVRKVIVTVQTGRYIIRNGNGGLVAAATAAGTLGILVVYRLSPRNSAATANLNVMFFQPLSGIYE